MTAPDDGGLRRWMYGDTPPQPPPAARARRATVARPRPLSEAQWQKQVTDLAEYLGYEWFHVRAARRKPGEEGDRPRWYVPVEGPLGEGWVDLFLIRPRDGAMHFAELKRQGERPTRAQDRVLGVLRAAETAGHARVHVWTAPDLEVVREALR